MQTVELFKALGDPTRLEMVEKLSHGRVYTITSISSGLNITRQGARKHLQILEDSHIVKLSPKGRDTLVELYPRTIETMKKFMAKLELQWDKRLGALKSFVEKK